MKNNYTKKLYCMLLSIRLPALLEEVEGFCQPQVIQGGDSQVMNSYLIPGLRSNMRQVRSSYEACKQEVVRHHLEKARYRQEKGLKGHKESRHEFNNLVGLPKYGQIKVILHSTHFTKTISFLYGILSRLC